MKKLMVWEHKIFLRWFKKTKYFKQYEKIFAIVGEPTNLSSIEIGHRGNAFIKIQALGKAGHGAKQHDFSDNAIEKFLATLGKIKKEFKNWQIEFEDYILGEPSLNITGIYTSGESINKIPSACFVTLDIRTTPKLHGKLLELLKKNSRRRNYHLISKKSN